MSNFSFLCAEWPDLFESAQKAEAFSHSDPRTACICARRALELAVRWAFKNDPALKLPYQEDLSALIHEPTFRNFAGASIFAKANLIRKLGNDAVHRATPIRQYDAITVVRDRAVA